MGIDVYQIEVLHFMNPHLIWAEISDVAAPLPIYEQIGLYGILPLESTIDEVEEVVKRKRSSEWMPAVSQLMAEALMDATEIVFLPAYIDRRTSIFDDNIHKYGELLIKKPDSDVVELSKVLIKSKVAFHDVVQFHQELSLGKLKTKLRKHQIKDVFQAMNQYYDRKDSTKDWKMAFKQQTQIYHAEQNLEMALTEENLQRHNQVANSPKYVSKCQDDMVFYKDIDETPLGRGMSRERKESDTSHSDVSSQITSDTKSMLQKKLNIIRKTLATLPVVNKSTNNTKDSNISGTNNAKDSDTSSSKSLNGFLENIPSKSMQANPTVLNNNVTNGKFFEQRSVHDESRNSSDSSHKSNTATPKIRSAKKLLEIKHSPTLNNKQDPGNMNQIRITEIEKTSNIKPNALIVPVTPTSNARSKSSSKGAKPPPYDPVTEKLVAYGPPGCDQSLLPLKVVPISAFEDAISPSTYPRDDEVLPKPEKDDFDDADSKVDISLAATKERIDIEKFPEIDVDDIEVMDINVAEQSPQEHGKIEAAPKIRVDGKNSGTLLQKLRTLKTNSFYCVDHSFSSDTSTKDTSSSFSENASMTKKTKEVESDEETICMTDIVDKLGAEYAEEVTVSPKEIEVKINPIITQKNYVNPFKNVDENVSVFVDKLVTPVLMVHSTMNLRFQPSFLMRDICFDAHTQVTLKNLGVEKPMTIQTLTWMSVLRGYSILMVGPKGSGKTMGYLPAVSRLLSIADASDVNSVGPSCIIVCATAISVSEVERLAKIFCIKKIVLALYTGMTDLELTTSVFNKCDLLICTPPILFRLLKSNDFGIDLRRLTTFVLDDCERLGKVYGAEIVYFQKKIRDMLRNRVPKEMRVQYIVASREWCDFMQPLAKAAPNAVVCISAFQECVLYSKANTSASFVTKDNKDKAVLDFLKLIDRSKKTVIVCRKDEEVNHLEKVLTQAKYVVVACNSTMDVQELYNLSLTLGNYHDAVSGLILVCCDGNVTHLNVTDAHNLIHYSLPNLFSMFCKRFSVLNENYPSMFKEENDEVKIKILLDDSNIEQIPKILHFIKRCTTSVPEVLDEICDKVLGEKDVAKAKDLVPICDSLLALGECPDYWNCRERHAVFKEYDEPLEWMPTSGEITFKLLHYQNAVFYSARLLTNIVNGKEIKYPQTYSMLSTKMSMYFATESNQKLHETPKVGDVCAVSVKQNFYVRCQVVKILSYYQRGNPNEVLIRLIDEEKLQKSRDIYLYHLPEEIKSAQTHTIQVRLAGVQPKEKDITFSKLASDRLKSITNADDELYLKGRIVLTIGNCVFVDTLVTCKNLTFSGSVIRHDLKQELLNSFAKTNPEHIHKLKTLCETAQLTKAPTNKQVEENVEVDLVKTKKELPEIRWAHLEKDEMCPTVFTYAIDPSTFFLRLLKFDHLMVGLINDIQTVAQNADPVTQVNKGDIILAKLPDDGMYERARIDEVLSDNKVKCFFVDQGDWREVAISDLAPIPDKFITRLPFQAIECRLYGVLPSRANWTDFSNMWLINCLEDHDGNPKRFYIKRFTKETAQFTGGHKYGIAIIDTSSETDVVINQAMVDVNMARANATEMKMIAETDFVKETAKYSDNESDDDQDEDWEKVPRQEHEMEKPKVPLEDLFPKKPIRSVPLVQSDDESESSVKWECNLNEDFMGLFKPVSARAQNDSNVLAIEGKDTESEASISVINSYSSIKELQDSKATIKELHDSKPVRYANTQSSSEVSVSILNSVYNSEDSDVKSLQSLSVNRENLTEANDSKALDSDDFTSPEPTVMITNEELKPVATKIIKNNIAETYKHPTAGQESQESVKDTERNINEPKVIEEKNNKKITTELKKHEHKPSKDETKQKNADELRKPKLLWRQNKTKVHIKIIIIVEEYKIQIEERRLRFEAFANDTSYGFDFELYGVIDTIQSKHDNKGQYILVTLPKILTRNWLSLTKDASIKKWIVYDVDSLDVSSDEDTESNVAAEVFNQMNADSDTEDEDFVDDFNFKYSK